MDVDDFKRFNTNFGYGIADEVLSKIGELLSKDKHATDETFRYFNKGDEFLVVTMETNQNGAIGAAERKRKLIQRTDFHIKSDLYNVTVSCGVTEYKSGDTYESITDRVIVALNNAKKEKGKNCTKSVI